MCWIDRAPPKMNKVFRIRPESYKYKELRKAMNMSYEEAKPYLIDWRV